MPKSGFGDPFPWVWKSLITLNLPFMAGQWWCTLILALRSKGRWVSVSLRPACSRKTKKQNRQHAPPMYPLWIFQLFQKVIWPFVYVFANHNIQQMGLELLLKGLPPRRISKANKLDTESSKTCRQLVSIHWCPLSCDRCHWRVGTRELREWM